MEKRKRYLDKAPNSLIVSNQSQPHRQPLKSKQKMLKISYIKGKYLENRYLLLFFVHVLHVLNAE